MIFSLSFSLIIFIFLYLGLIYSSYNEFHIIIQQMEFLVAYFVKTCRILFFLFIFGVLAKALCIRVRLFVCRFNFRMDCFGTHHLERQLRNRSESTRLFPFDFNVKPYKATFSACCNDKISLQHGYKL